MTVFAPAPTGSIAPNMPTVDHAIGLHDFGLVAHLLDGARHADSAPAIRAGLLGLAGDALDRAAERHLGPDSEAPEFANAAVSELSDRMQAVHVELGSALAARGTHLTTPSALEPGPRAALRSLFAEELFPILTPQTSTSARSFRFVPPGSLNLVVAMHLPSHDGLTLGRVTVPRGVGLPRFIAVPGCEHTFVALERVVEASLDLLFPEARLETCGAFRAIRAKRAEDELEGPVVRLEVEPTMPELQQALLASHLHLDLNRDVQSAAFLAASDWKSLAEFLPVR